MITYETIVKQIEKLTTEAAHAATEQQAREKLTAIRALCDVVLDEKVSSPTPASINSMSTMTSSPYIRNRSQFQHKSSKKTMQTAIHCLIFNTEVRLVGRDQPLI